VTVFMRAEASISSHDMTSRLRQHGWLGSHALPSGSVTMITYTNGRGNGVSQYWRTLLCEWSGYTVPRAKFRIRAVDQGFCGLLAAKRTYKGQRSCERLAHSGLVFS